MPGCLYVVSTPIGNLDDITLRALNTLKAVSLIAAEDTRRTSILLNHFGISTPATSFHEHNETKKADQLLAKLHDGNDIALVSDAGTPVVADPGQRLIARAAREGIRVIPIPGASAVLAALTVSGYPADSFVFAGFAPSKSNDRLKWLKALVKEERPVVLFEAPHRIEKMLTDLGVVFGDRPITITRELTKLHEQVTRSTAAAAANLDIPERGEFTIVIGPLEDDNEQPEVVDDNRLVSYFYQLIENSGLTRRKAIVATANNFGLTPNDVYERIERSKTVSQS